MKVAIIGAGGVGGYYGGLLARAGCDVHLLARGAHLDALRTRGLEIRTPAHCRATNPTRIETAIGRIAPAAPGTSAARNSLIAIDR